MSRIRVLIADDHAVMREGLARLIADQPDMRVICEVGDGEATLSACTEHEPHVVLLDMRMPGLGGVAAIRRLRREFPGVRVLVLSMYEDERYVRAALAAGAHAYLGKRSAAGALLRAIRALHAGEAVASSPSGAPAASGRAPALRAADPVSPTASGREPLLSSREREIVQRVVAGHTSREIASALGISKSSVDTYRARVFRKLGVENRAGLFTRIALARDASSTELE